MKNLIWKNLESIIELYLLDTEDQIIQRGEEKIALRIEDIIPEDDFKHILDQFLEYTNNILKNSSYTSINSLKSPYSGSELNVEIFDIGQLLKIPLEIESLTDLNLVKHRKPEALSQMKNYQIVWEFITGGKSKDKNSQEEKGLRNESTISSSAAD